MKRRAQFNEFVTSTTSLTISRYFRLMALATVEILCTTPIAAYGIYLNATLSPIQPWKGFADAHYNYSHIGQYPAVVWRSNHYNAIAMELTRWSLVFCALVFFGFFGFADEARKNYHKLYRKIVSVHSNFPKRLTKGHSYISYVLVSNRVIPSYQFYSADKHSRSSPPIVSVDSLPAYAAPTTSEFFLTISSTKDCLTVINEIDCLPGTPDSDVTLGAYIGAHAV